jgi:D-tyrosyl-tRNA(Tyr) deacylase
MRAVVQRVSNASVTVADEQIAFIEHGLLVYLGVERDDGEKEVAYMAKKISNMRLFADSEGKINLSVKDVEAKILAVSQFTLCADLDKGNRPSFNPAAEPNKAQLLYEMFVEYVQNEKIEVETGLFGASMKVSYTNEGPVTIIVEKKFETK